MLFERLKDDSEDNKGGKRYLKERCQLYKQMIKDQQQQHAQVEQRRERIKKENERLKELGRPPIALPAPYLVKKREIESKLRHFEEAFKKIQYDKKEQEIIDAGYGKESLAS